METPDTQLTLIKRGTAELIDEKELRVKLAKGVPLRVKAGFDPTAPDLHLGHTVLLQKLKQFQDLGHQVIFLIGDYTARVGDPSGRSEMRPMLSPEEITANVKTYESQVFKILDRKKTEVRFNSEWLAKMTPADFLALAAQVTVARMLERDDFHKRFKEGKEISILEFLYPLLQGYDSVVLKADVELGGNDQKFNLLMGRVLQRRSGVAEQVILTLPLLAGTDGVRKMSKSYGNAVVIFDPPGEMYGKLLSISDEVMWRYYELLSDCAEHVIADRRKTWHPKAAKQALAREIVTRFHSAEAAEAAEAEFERVFSRHEAPETAEETVVAIGDGLSLVALVKDLGFAASNGEARRLIEQGGVSLDGERVTDPHFRLDAPRAFLLRAGKKRFKRVILK
jgi:tyrosyl-tRNA synthetase